MIIYLIRHGATCATERRLYCGSTDIPLSTDGRRRLEGLRGSFAVPEGARFITSGMRRCDETLEILFGDVDFERDPRLREMDFGEFEMRGYEELKTTPAYQEWITGDNEGNRTPGGESGKETAARAVTAFREIVSAGRDAVIVTHGGVIAAVMADLFPEENKSRYEWQPDCGEGYRLVLRTAR